MKIVTLSAHFDGRNIRLDVPYDLAAGARLLVTVLADAKDDERTDWVSRSKAGLARAYSPDEPDYPASMLRRYG